LSYRRKEDARDYPTFIQLGLKKGVLLPAGLNAGHQISLLIDRETLPYANLKSFDELPITYRCVATDLVSGKGSVSRTAACRRRCERPCPFPGFNPVHRRLGAGRWRIIGNLPTDGAGDGAE
jgi:NTE family protein